MMIPNGAVYTPTDTVYGEFGTFDPANDGVPITLAGTPSLRLTRVRSGTWSEITGNGIALRVDEDDTGRHEYEIDLDDANIAAAAGDQYQVIINAGTVAGNSVVGVVVGSFFVQADGLTAQQKADVNTEADTAVSDRFGAKISSSVNDVSATTTGFTTAADQGSVVLYGIVELTSGALDGESRVAKWTGTTLTLLGDSDMDAAEKQFSSAPANSVTFDFYPLRS